MLPDDPTSPSSPSGGVARFRSTAHLAAALTRAAAPDEVPELALTHAMAALQAAMGGVFLLDAAEEHLLLVAQHGYPPDPTGTFRRLRLDDPAVSLPVLDVMRDGRALFLTLDDLARDHPALLAPGGRPPGALAVAPLRIEERLLGVIVLRFSGDRAFTALDRDFTLTLAGLCALGLERARAEAARQAWQALLERQVEERTRELRERNDALAAETTALHTFASFTEAVAHETRLDVLTQVACDVLHTAFGEGSVVYYEEQGGRWTPRAFAGEMAPDTRAFVRAGLPPDFPLFGQARAARGAVFVDAWSASGEDVAAHTSEYGTVGAYPVLVGEDVRGFLTVGLTSTACWSERSRAVFRAVGRSLILAAERAADAAAAARSAALLEERNHTLEDRARDLREHGAELDAFSFSVSHDLRTPLRHMLGFAALLRRSLGPDALARGGPHLDVIEQAARRMDTLVDALLGFARTAREPLRFSPVDLGALVAEVRGDLAPDVLGRCVTWRVGPLPTLHGDRGLLRQVLGNLLGNAVKYTRGRDESVVEVWAERGAGEWSVFVGDNGVGFDPRYGGKLFGAFQRLHRADEFDGVGIGLANVQRIVARHGGRVWAQGEVDVGATFGFSLPDPE